MNLVTNLTKEDLPLLKKFIAKQFHNKYILLNDKFFEWQYKLSPGNKFTEYAMKIIKFKEDVMGYNGLAAVQMNVFGKVKTGAHFSNLMIDEKCRGFGLGTVLIKKSSSEFQICYTTGYNIKTENIYLRLGNWTKLGNLKRFVKILDGKKSSKLAKKNTPFKEITKKKVLGFKLEKVKCFDEKMNEFWEKIKRKYPITISRTKEYLNWRYSNHPILKYNLYICIKGREIKGFAVVRIEGAEEDGEKYIIARIIDFIAEDSAEEFLANSIVGEMRREKADLVDFFFSGNFHVKALKAQGFVECKGKEYKKIPLLFSPISRKRNFINLIVYAEDYKGREKEFTNVNNWYVTKGDGDQDRPN